MSAMHIFLWEDGAKTAGQKYPLCGQVNASGVVIAAGDPIPPNATCKRCIKRADTA